MHDIRNHKTDFVSNAPSLNNLIIKQFGATQSGVRHGRTRLLPHTRQSRGTDRSLHKLQARVGSRRRNYCQPHRSKSFTVRLSRHTEDGGSMFLYNTTRHNNLQDRNVNADGRSASEEICPVFYGTVRFVYTASHPTYQKHPTRLSRPLSSYLRSFLTNPLHSDILINIPYQFLNLLVCS